MIYDNNEQFPIGGLKVVRKSDKDTATVIGAGVTLFEALKAHDELKAKGISIRVIDLYSVQPIDAASLIEAGKQTGRLITVEDHYFVRAGSATRWPHAVAAAGLTVHAARGARNPAQRQARRAHRQVRHLRPPHRQCGHRLTMKRAPPPFVSSLILALSNFPRLLPPGRASAPSACRNRRGRRMASASRCRISIASGR